MTSTVAAISVAHAQEERVTEEVCRGNEFAARHVASTLYNRLHQFGDAVDAAADDPELHRACQQRLAGRRGLSDETAAGQAAESWRTAVRHGIRSGSARNHSPELPQQHKVVGGNFAERDYFRGGSPGPRARIGYTCRRFSRQKTTGSTNWRSACLFDPRERKARLGSLRATVPADALSASADCTTIAARQSWWLLARPAPARPSMLSSFTQPTKPERHRSRSRRNGCDELGASTWRMTNTSTRLRLATQNTRAGGWPDSAGPRLGVSGAGSAAVRHRG